MSLMNVVVRTFPMLPRSSCNCVPGQQWALLERASKAHAVEGEDAEWQDDEVDLAAGCPFLFRSPVLLCVDGMNASEICDLLRRAAFGRLVIVDSGRGHGGTS